MNSVGLRAPTLVIASFFGLETAGLFSLCSRVLALPLSIVGRSVLQVSLGEGARLVREQPETLRGYFIQMMKRQSILAFAIPLATLPAPFLFRFAFGASWETAGSFAQILSISCALQFVSNPMSACLDLTERQDLHLIRECFRLVILGGGILIIGAYEINSIQAVSVLSGVGSLSCIGSLAISLLALRDWDRQICGQQTSLASSEVAT